MAWRGIRAATIRGIPVRIDASFLVILPLLAFSFGQAFRRAAEAADVPPERLGGSPWAWGALVAVALFASVLVHELAHSLYAVRRGGRVADITLMLVGGVSRMTEPPHGKRAEAWMALVGPLTSFALAALFYAAHAAARGSGSFNLQFAFFHLALLNLSLGVFNLLPAFPLDGGRVVRGLLAPRFGQVRATRAAAFLGKAFAVLFALGGLAGGNLLLVVIAFLVFVGATAEERQVVVEQLLGGLRIADLMTPRTDAVRATDTVLETGDWMLGTTRPVSPVLGEDGLVAGVVTMDALRRVPVARRSTTLVGEVVTETPRLTPDEPVSRALRAMAGRGVVEVPVTDPTVAGRLVGTIGEGDVARALEAQQRAQRRRRWSRPAEST